MADLVSIGTALVTIITKITQHCEQRAQNADVVEDLHGLLKSLHHYIRETQEKARVLRSNSALWALDSLKKDLENATRDASRILNKGLVRSLWDAKKIQSRLQGLRDRIMTSFQTRLSVAALDVLIEGKQAQDSFQEAMLKVNKELQESCFTTSVARKQEQQAALRKELREALLPLTVALKSQTHKIEAAMSTIRHSFEPQITNDAEKFFQDVLAALDGLSIKSVGEDDGTAKTRACASQAKQSSSLVKWYQDPVTWENMCDPVKATDGHTYDRWTIVKNSCRMARSPFDLDDPRPFDIACDDIDVRSRLFHKLPQQESQFRAKRTEYRAAALNEAQLGHFGDSASMLRRVLQWAPRDVECRERLQYVECQMEAESSTSIPSNRLEADDASVLAREVFHQSQPQTGIWSDNTNISGANLLKQSQPPTGVRLDNTSSSDANLVVAKEVVDQSQPHTGIRSDNTNSSDANLLDQCQQHTGIRSDNTSSYAALAQYQLLYPSRLDSTRSNGRLLRLSSDGLSCKIRRQAAAAILPLSYNVGAAIADVAVPVPDELQPLTTFFYFEITIEMLNDDEGTVVGLGFTSSDSFCDTLLPGSYPFSCGYCGSLRATEMENLGVQGHIIVRQGDTMGAGIHHGYKKTFFVHNGAVVAVMGAAETVLMPVVALRSRRQASVKVAFNNFVFRPEQRPSRLVLPARRDGRISAASLCPDGLNVWYWQKYSLDEDNPDVSFHADCCACFGGPRPIYYFEATIQNRSWSPFFTFAIGFARREFFDAGKMPGHYPNSCAYSLDGTLCLFDYPEGAKKFDRFSGGDTVGAGIDYSSSTIFFTKNGRMVGDTNGVSGVPMSCALYPVLGLHHAYRAGDIMRSPHVPAMLSLNFGAQRFQFSSQT